MAKTISLANYKASISAINLDNYQPSGSTTYCNLYAQAVMNEYGYALPSGTCASIFDGLYNNVNAHWKSTDFSGAQTRANQGYPAVAITSGKAKNSPDTSMPEHIVVVYPSNAVETSLSNVKVSQAGKTCFSNGKISQSWTATDLPKARFYSYY